MNWKEYEKEIHKYFLNEYPNAIIKYDVGLDGIYSKTKRQIDILVEDYAAGNRFRIVVDCKYFKRKIDIKCVESFLGFLNDIGAHKGLLITQKGYSRAAVKRAYNDPKDTELDILNFDELKEYQGFGGFPIAGRHTVFLQAPFGWILDPRQDGPFLCTMYQRGISRENATRNFEWMYVNFYK